MNTGNSIAVCCFIRATVAVDRVDERGLVKVADFGLSRELIVQDYYRLCHSKTPVPVRWMAPESLSANVFTTMSDVVRSDRRVLCVGVPRIFAAGCTEQVWDANEGLRKSQKFSGKGIKNW